MRWRIVRQSRIACEFRGKSRGSMAIREETRHKIREKTNVRPAFRRPRDASEGPSVVSTACVSHSGQTNGAAHEYGLLPVIARSLLLGRANEHEMHSRDRYRIRGTRDILRLPLRHAEKQSRAVTRTCLDIGNLINSRRPKRSLRRDRNPLYALLAFKYLAGRSRFRDIACLELA